MADRWLVCQREACGRIFAADRPSSTQHYCSRSCARLAEHEARKPTKEQQIEAVMLAIRREVGTGRRVLLALFLAAAIEAGDLP